MAKLAYFPWYPAETAADGWWRSLTLAEKGLHLELLSIAWPEGGLEQDLNVLARSVGISRLEFDKLWPRVSRKWTSDGTRLVNNRQERERCKIGRISIAAADAAHRRWHKNGNAVACATASNSQCQGTARASDSDSDSFLKEKETKVLFDPNFEVWAEMQYARHPKKREKFLSLQALMRQFAGHPDLQTTFNANHALWCVTESWCEKNGRFAPLLSDFIRDEGWKYPPNTETKSTNAFAEAVKKQAEEL
jgi:uncharacterized protein YdaU (DUF1376 family)